jgi:hypothetical protein
MIRTDGESGVLAPSKPSEEAIGVVILIAMRPSLDPNQTLRAAAGPNKLRAAAGPNKLRAVCLLSMLMMLACTSAQAHLILGGKRNVCFAERIGDDLRPAWNAPVTGEEITPPAADPESTGPIAIHFDDDLTETTASIGDDYFDWLDVHISGLSLGQKVVIERFRVDNDQGIINPDAVLMESHQMQDGYLPLIGDIPNLSSVEDWDGERDGEIWTQLGMFGGLANMPGEYVIRVSSPLGSFPPATARLTIDEVPTDQFFFGQVVDDLGEPIPNAFVALLEPLGGYSEILFAAQADEDGYYLLYAPYPDEVDLVAAAPGYVSRFQDGNSVYIDEDEISFEDIELLPGSVTLSGQILRDGTNEPIAGLPVSFLTVDENNQTDGRLISHTWTNTNGEFSVNVTPDRWALLVKAYEASSRNLITPAIEPRFVVDTSDELDVTNWVVHFEQASCVIGGFLYGEDGEPLPQVQMMALNRETDEMLSGYTLEDGAFTLPAKPGTWEVTPFSYDLEVARHPGAMTTYVRLTEPNKSVIIQQTAMEINAILDGTITYESADPELDGKPVGNLMLWAQSIRNSELVSVFQNTYNFNGYYNIYLPEGNWFVIPEPYESARRQLLLKNLPRLEVEHDDEEIAEIEWDIVAVDPQRMIEVAILDPEGNPIPGIPMHAEMDDGSDTYDAFGVTDANGVATIPARAGHWELHISHSTMRRAGFSQFPHQHVMVPGGGGDPVALPLTATPFTGAMPEMTSVRTEDGNLKINGTAEPGKQFDVEGSFDVQDWFYTGRVIALNGEFAITDPLDAGHEESVTGQPGKRVFYRLKNPQ